MTIRFSKNGKWYAIGEKLPGGTNGLQLVYRRNGYFIRVSTQVFFEDTGDYVDYPNGMYFGGVLHKFLTLSSIRLKTKNPLSWRKLNGAYYDTGSIPSGLIFKKVNQYQWTATLQISPFGDVYQESYYGITTPAVGWGAAGTAPAGSNEIVVDLVWNSSRYRWEFGYSRYEWDTMGLWKNDDYTYIPDPGNDNPTQQPDPDSSIFNHPQLLRVLA